MKNNDSCKINDAIAKQTQPVLWTEISPEQSANIRGGVDWRKLYYERNRNFTDTVYA